MPFAPGDPRINRNGRPRKENCLTDILKEMGNIEDVSNNGEMIDRKKALAESIWRKAIVDKDLASIKYIFDRIDGTPHTYVSIEQIGEPVESYEETLRKIDELLAKRGTVETAPEG